MLPIAVDAMGGDRAPGEIVAGARQAADAPACRSCSSARPTWRAVGDLPLIEASEVIAMDEDPAKAVRRKKDSSLVRAAEAVRDGKASAMISAGNTGATMASALLRMGRIKGVSRPADRHADPGARLDAPPSCSTPAPTPRCQPEWLVQFAQMGSVYARHRFGIAEPKVGLLSIGEEPGKGDRCARRRSSCWRWRRGIDFVGNVEGRDIMTDGVDVVVTDGFTGNVVLKALEGGVRMIVRALLAAMQRRRLRGAPPTR